MLRPPAIEGSDMNKHPFPIPVVAAIGPGSQSDDETLDYIRLPSGMDVYRPPSLPEPEELGGHQGAVHVLRQTLEALALAAHGQTVEPIVLDDLGDADRRLLNQVLGEGEVSAQVLAEAGRASVQAQESVFAGVWRVLETLADGRLLDRIEVGDVPAALRRAAWEDGEGAEPALPPAPPGVLNAHAVLTELRDHRATWREGQLPQVINLTLLPMTPEDIAYMDHGLGTGRVLVLSRGYGNCRITDTRVPNTWRIVYYNSQDAVILNTVEVCAMPEVACAALEDLADSHERLAEVLAWVET
jgi:hydrogenase-1 operon protein HyaF